MDASKGKPAEKKATLRTGVQGFGRFLSGMVMPNLGAFIAWGLITALFIPTGWIPNEQFAALVDPMIVYLLPLLIGYSGGKLVGGKRGGVIGAIATMGVVVGAEIPMFLGAMIMGPLGGLAIKKFDRAIEGKVPAGFEMLINNFAAGIIGAILAMLALIAIGPIVLGLNNILKTGVETIVNLGLLPLTSVFIEPGKILFLNNAINHGVLGPIGIQEAKEIGKSIFFLLEANPGPGLGVLLAYWFFSKGTVKESAPSAIIIHFFGGIHEIYFPYVLMNPALILAVIAGGASGIATFQLFGAGLIAPPSPGSIIAVLAMTPKNGYLGIIAGVAVSTVVTFLIASIFVKRSANKMSLDDLESAKGSLKELKGVKKESLAGIKKIIFACDAGMGSSAMGATMIRKKLTNNKLDIAVTNCAINDIPTDASMVITHNTLVDRAKLVAPKAEIIGIQDFLDGSVYDSLVADIKNNSKNNSSQTEIQPEPASQSNPESKSQVQGTILTKDNIKLGLESTDKYTAIKMAGEILVKGGYVEPPYIEAMIEREDMLTTYMGKGIAIPHGVSTAKETIKKSGVAILQFPQGIDFGDEKAYLVIGIAGFENEHLGILASVATTLEEADEEMFDRLRSTDDVAYMLDLFSAK